MKRKGLTLIELFVVIFIIGVLIALLLPGVQAARESARRVQCTSNMTQMVMAIHHYEHAHRVYPPGVLNDKRPIKNFPFGYHHNWISQSLPYLEASIIDRHVDRKVGVYHKNNKRVRSVSHSFLRCPSGPRMRGEFGRISNYAAVHHDVNAPIDEDNKGVFFLNSRVRKKDITDGLGFTFFVGEKVSDSDDLGWMSGTYATLRNMGQPINSMTEASFNQVGADGSRGYLGFPGATENNLDQEPVVGYATPYTSFDSYHDSGTQFAFGDGRVKFLHEDMDLKVLQALANRADGQIFELPAYADP